MADTKAPLLDRAIAQVAPRVALKRARARAALDVMSRSAARRRGYEGAAKGRRTKDWEARGGSANAEIGPQLPLLRHRSRALVRNNAWAARAIDVIEANTVGEGITPQARAGREEVARKVEDLWKSWGGTTACDANGCSDFYGLQALTMRTVAESGEALIRRRPRRAADGLPVPLQIEVLEPDYLDTTKDGPRKGGGSVVGGIQFNAFGQREGYYLFSEHPGEVGRPRSFRSNFVPASQVRHVFKVERPGQVRGVPWAAPVMLRLRDLDKYEDAELLRRELASCYVAFEHDITAPEDWDGKAESDLDELQAGAIEKLPNGRTITLSSPPQPQGYSEYVVAILRAIAGGFGITYEELSNDLSRANFSANRMGRVSFRRNVQRWQKALMIQGMCIPVWDWFIEAAVTAGYTYAEGVGGTWTTPMWELTDPTKEVPALIKQVRAGMLAPSDAARMMGRDPDELFGEWAKDAKRFDELKLVFDSDPRKGKSGKG